MRHFLNLTLFDNQAALASSLDLPPTTIPPVRSSEVLRLCGKYDLLRNKIAAGIPGMAYVYEGIGVQF
jgi:hypothetical protein